MSEPLTHVAPLRIDASHPSLPGHFPGHPVVPGVVLLDHVQQAAQRWLGKPLRIRALPQAKFLAPLLPEQQAQIQLTLQDQQLRFGITRDDVTIAQGIMQIAEAQT
jgi:3-hydroxymyristoyl/3-hydroxydecanoyl-(acyl carrier protein) dehydratase